MNRAMRRRRNVGPSTALLEAREAGWLAIHFLQDRDAPFPAEMLLAETKPALLVICDADGHSTGPDGWVCAYKALRWAPSAFPTAVNRPAEWYGLLIQEILEQRQIVLIETAPPWLNAWYRAVGDTPLPLEVV